MDISIPDPPAPQIIDVQVASKTTLAAAQNAVQILKQIQIYNSSDYVWSDLKLSLTPQPAFCRPKVWAIDRVLPGDTVALTDRELTFDYATLDRLNEAEHGQLTFVLHRGSEVLAEQTYPIELLARDEWGGSGEMAQILAAFVSPNHPATASILNDAARILEQNGHSGALDGYQSPDPRRAYLLAASVWSAVSGWGIDYAQPPASFEQQGQKIRDPGVIRDTGLGTCLDTTLLLAAAFEALGLHPVVIFTRGHAFVGVWQIDQTFPMTVESDGGQVRKAIDARELIVLESTLLTHRPAASFSQALDNGRAQLFDDGDKPFHMAIDISRARSAGIRPLSSRGNHAQPPSAAEDSVAAAALPSPPRLDELPVEIVEEMPSTPEGRLDRWQKKLLDLTYRNRLLNFTPTRQVLRLLCPDVAALEDALAAGERFRIISLKDENPVGNRDPQAYRQQTGRDIERDFADTAFGKGQICALETGREMQSRLTALFRKAKSDLAEGGANTLFMAVGFLRFKKDGADERRYSAPLLLLPIKLTRRSAKSDFFVSHHEDDVVFNQTLLELLDRDFGIQIPALRGVLPEDESGLDITRIIATVKNAIRDVPGFEVVEETAISTFSFSKYLMWKDLVDRSDSLRNNRLVRHLLDNPTEPFTGAAQDLPTADSIDTQVDAAKLYTPLPADSSQLAAIVGAESGNDFVIIGPPGTGKSQTIANMIAHCMAHGKTVLFVAEKAAALDVVHRRLKSYGLADACLELHSNKADRRSVISQLGAAWDRASNADVTEWIRLTDTLKVHRDELNDYVTDLHTPGSHGRSVFDAIGIVGDRQPKFALQFPNPDVHDPESFESLTALAERLALTHRAVEGCETLELVHKTEWSFKWQNDLQDAATKLRDDATDLQEACTRLQSLVGVSGAEVRNERLTALLAFSKAIGDAAKPDVRMVTRDDLDALRPAVDALADSINAYKTAKSSLAATYEDSEILRMPIDDIDRDWRQQSAKTWPLSLIGRRRVQRLLQSYAADGVADPDRDLQPLLAMQGALRDAAESPAASLPQFRGVCSDAEGLLGQLKIAAELRRAAERVCQSDIALPDVLSRIADLLPADRASCQVAEAAQSLLEQYDILKVSAKNFATLSGTKLSMASLSGLARDMNALLDQSTRLNDWVKWSQVRQEAQARGLGPMVEALTSDKIEDAANEFSVAYFTWWLPLAIDRKSRLRGFVHWEHDDRVAKFRTLVDEVQKLAAGQIRRAVSHDLPARDGVPRKSELGLLRHQLGLQRPSQPIRGLIEAMPQTFTKLTPCVLMSPLSVAQYLPTQQATFDLVIFDEASQITTWDAVGAIARGRQSIIVGDPKQLPPTNFFGRTEEEVDEELEEYERDLPSILDEAAAAGLPTHQLNWHYRSRDEALIAFSNRRYYGQRLVTFPSPVTASTAVQFHKVDGIYARGAGRTNEIEARKVVKFIVRRLERWAELPADQRPSIGVITFNSQQQDLIQDLLDQARTDRPHLEWFFAEDREEPVIVKNLENVQGDERDVMVFSITFGPDIAGKISMTFGAVNKDGGEKRLNVAVTRAKSEFHVFSSISADDIDLNRTKSLGVKHLKNYLDYAERGIVALAAMDEGSLGDADSPFEISVAQALQAKGWEVRTQVGVSGFRIDLGVVHPDKAGAFLAGVECDGATYHRSATARDRDQIREAVLRNLGWEILRIWSTDWFMRQQDALKRIDDALHQLLERSREEAREEATPPDPEILDDEAELEVVVSDHKLVGDDEDRSGDADEDVAGQEREEMYASQQVVYPAVSTDAETQTPEIAETFDCDASLFYESAYSQKLTNLVDRLVKDHGPISETMLFRQVARLHGWQRAGRRIQERVLNCIGDSERFPEHGNVFVWPAGQHRDRIPFRPSLDRPARDIPQAEILGLIDDHLHVLDSDDPAKHIATLMGLGRLSADTRDYLEACTKEHQRKTGTTEAST